MREREAALTVRAWAKGADGMERNTDMPESNGWNADPAGAVERLLVLGEERGQVDLPEAYMDAFGRTMFDAQGSEDGLVTVIMHADKIDAITSQTLVRIHSHPDGRNYVGSVRSGPFYDPDGISANSPPLVISAVNGATGMPGHHGRAEVSILGEEKDGRIGPANRRPRPNSPVKAVSDEEMASILGLEGEFSLGTVMGHESVEVPVPVRRKSVLCRHTAILGTTGGGKSTTVTNFVAGLAGEGAAVVLLDTEGEYTTVNEPTDNRDMLALLAARNVPAMGMPNTHVYVLAGREPANPDHPDCRTFCLDFTALSPWAVIEILEMNEAQQGRFLAAYDVARKLLVETGTFPATGDAGQVREAMEYDEFDHGYPCLSLDLLIDVVARCLAKAKGSDGEEHVFSAVMKAPGASDRLKQLLQRADLEKSPQSWMKVIGLLHRLRRLAIFDRRDAASLDAGEMLHPGRVNVVDLSGLDSPVLRNLAISQVLRGVQAAQEARYEAAAAAGEVPIPTNVIIEEAHEFLSAARIRSMPVLHEQVARIAKRGRKRWLGLTFVTQLPQNLPDEVLALVNNWILHKIQDESVVGRLKRTIPSIDQALWRQLASLQPGQAVVSLAHMRRPILTSMHPSPYRLRLEN